ncbi:MAG: restriction endonuclease subunit S [Flammeovirgaceae bacterium]|nr:restriction endonuclease subunit S [Flammeovirgaceae bacterium]
MSNWSEYKLGELIVNGKADLQTGPFGTMLNASEYSSDGVPVIAVQDIGDNKLIYHKFVYVNQETAERLKRYRVLENDIIFGRKGAVERRALIKKAESGWLQGSDCIRLRVDSSIDAKFISYQLGSSYHRDWLMQHATGATMPSLNQDVLKLLPLKIPPLAKQKEISDILDSIDKKIDLLHRQNKILEQLAETLFRQWFVEEAEESWEVGKLDDVISVKGGTTPSTSQPEFWNGHIHWTSPRDLSSASSIFLFDTERKITEKGLAQIGSGLLPVGTVLLSSRAPIGYLTITEIPVAINQGYIAIVCDKLVSNYFIFLWCRANMDTIENAGNGSVFQEISKASFKNLELVIPPNDKLKLFNKEIEPLFQKLKYNTIQIHTLTQLRDTLLPKLMSGEARINY